MSNPRVLILSWEYPPIVEGGLARHVCKLAQRLVATGIEVHVLTRGVNHSQRDQECDGVHVHRVQEPDYPKGDLDAFIAWTKRMNTDMFEVGRELCEAHEIDIIHSHEWLVAGAAQRLRSSFKLPWIVTVHATEYGRHQGWVEKYPQSYIHAIETDMVRQADRVIACSHYMREHIADVFSVDEDAVTVIPNGIDPLDLVPDIVDLDRLRARFAQPHERLILLVGRLVYEKGFQLALQALPQLQAELGNIRFLVAGSGTHEQQLKQQADQLGLSELGSFLGWIDDGMLHSLYRISDLCVVPSIYEPFGLVALEAMASGCPCIVSDTGGLREVVPGDESVGLRFAARDSSSLAAMVTRLLTEDELRERLVNQASTYVLQFDWLDVAERTGVVYRELISVSDVQSVAAV